MHEQAAKKAKLDIEVPWDDLRAARVHNGALDAFRAAQDEDEQQVRDKLQGVGLLRPRMLLAAVALMSVAAAVVLYLRSDDGHPVAASSWAGASTLHYADGSRSLLSQRAKVHVLEDSNERVRVRQDGGKVRYEIARRPERRFEVGALDVTITVLGTIFDVAVDEGRVMVTVERGRVRVEHGDRRLELTAGQKAEIEAALATAPREAPENDEASDQAEPQQQAAATDAERGPAAAAGAAGGRADAAVAPTAAELMRRADQERAAGQLATAAATLRTLIAKHPRDGRATLALYTLGRIERQRGNHQTAATSFEQCGAALRGDAIAEAAGAWSAAGRPARARAAAERYLRSYPAGVHAERMRALAGGG